MRPRLSGPVTRRAVAAAVGACGVGLLGALPRAGGEVDPVALVAWLGLVAAAAGWACGASGVRVLPLGLAVPAVWMAALVQVELVAARDLARAVAPALGWTGLFLAGLGAGALAPGTAWRGGGALLFVALVLAGAGVAGGLAEPGSGVRPPVAWLDASPAGLLLDLAGQDWTHESALVYRRSGVEYAHRAPWPAGVASAALVVVGWVLAAWLPALAHARAERGRRTG